MNEQIARYREIERRGLLNQLPEEKQALWAEIKRRGLDDPYSATEKLQYTLRAGADLPTFGTANLGAGLTNVLATDAARAFSPSELPGGRPFAERVKSAQKIVDILNPVGGWQAKLEAVRSPEFKQGRKGFIAEQEQFKQEHPGLQALGEYGIGGVVGGVAAGGKKLATEAIKQPLKEISRQSAKAGMKFGGAYGGLSSLASDPERIDVGQALLNTGAGAVGGAALGAAAPYAVSGAVKAVKGVAKPVARVLGIGAQEAEQGANVALERIVKQNPELVKKSIEEGTPLINIADKKLFRTTRGAVSTDAEAEQIMADYAQKFNAQKAGKVENLINEQLGSKSSSGVTEDIINAGRAKYQPIYEEVMKAGDLQIPIKNQRVLNAMSQVLKEYPELNNLPATDIRVLDLVKQRLDDQISVALRKGANNQARLLSQAKNELVRDIDAKIPQYAEARKAFKSMKDLEGLVEKGRSIKQLGREELGAMYEKVAPEERAALKGGIRDVLIRDLDRINSEGANAVRKVFSPSMLNKLKRIGLSEDKIVKAVEAENLANANVQGVFGGSNTAQKIADILNNTQQVSVGRAVMSPMRTAKRFGTKAIDYLVQRIQNSSPAETARLMTDPAYLKSEYERLYGGVGKALKAGKQQGPGVGAAIKVKLTEKGGFAMKPLEEDTQIAYHGSPVKGIKQFDTAFMGTGEGPQAHGWGAYFAKNKVTGEGYRERLSRKSYNPDNDFDVAQYYFARNRYDREKALKQLAEDINADGKVASKNGAYKILQTATDHELANTGGQLYEVKIPKNDVLLDEQKTFSEQPKKVQEALRKMAKDNIEIARNYTLQEGIDENLTGGKMYNLLEMDLKNTWRNLGDKSGADPAEYVSKGLNEYGIKGIAYDGRQDGRSFVIFNPMKDTKINRTFYSVLAALASAGLLNNQEAK